MALWATPAKDLKDLKDQGVVVEVVEVFEVFEVFCWLCKCYCALLLSTRGRRRDELAGVALDCLTALARAVIDSSILRIHSVGTCSSRASRSSCSIAGSVMTSERAC